MEIFITLSRVFPNITPVKFDNFRISGIIGRNSLTLLGHPNSRNSTINTSHYRAHLSPNRWNLDLKLYLSSSPRCWLSGLTNPSPFGVSRPSKDPKQNQCAAQELGSNTLCDDLPFLANNILQGQAVRAYHPNAHESNFIVI